MKANLVLQSFGRESEYLRATLAIWSYFAHAKSTVELKVYLFTDNQDYFVSLLEGIEIQYVELTEEKIKRLRGDINFLHRMKIGIIEEAFTLSSGPLLYVDSDTFFIKDPTKYLSQVSSEVAFMHLLEYCFDDIRFQDIEESPMTRFLELIKKHTHFQLSDDISKIEVSLQDCSWNAGVMIFDESHQKYIPDVFALTEQFYPKTECHAAEQFAFSLIFQKNTELKPCFDSVYHYWYHVKKKIVDLELPKFFNNKWNTKDFDDRITSIRSFTERLPSIFHEHQMTYEDNSISAFYEGNKRKAYALALKSILKYPNIKFVKDVLYHSKLKSK